MSDVNEKICRLEESRIFFNRNRIEEFSQNKKRRLEVYKILKYVGLIIMNCFIYNISFGDVTGLNAQNEKEWISYTLPLPHEISIKKKVTIPVKNLSIKTAKDAGAVVNNAARLLKMFYMAKTGTEAKGDGFEIIIGKIDKNGYVDTLQVPNWQRLTKLKNNDQAYFIIPVQDNKLLVTGLNEKGIFYGVQTLKQLLNKDINETQVVIPLATITDWPDLSCRGLWNGESLLLYEYLSMVKLNYAKNYVASSPFIRKGKISILKQNLNYAFDLWEKAKLFAFDNVPNVTHLNFFPHPHMTKGDKIYDVWPELAGQGDTALQDKKKPYLRVPCASNPVLVNILTDILKCFAAKGITEVSVWTSEFYSYCSCEKCLKEGQMVLEARAIANAWRNIRKQYPDFKVRILGFPLPRKKDISGGKYRHIPAVWNYEEQIGKIMNELPKEIVVEIVYPHRKIKDGSISDPELDVFAQKGYTLVEYNAALNTSWTNFLDFGEIPFTRQDARSLLSRRWQGMMMWFSYPAPGKAGRNSIKYASQGIFALAEWTWNANGRSIPDFIKSWALVTGATQEEAELLVEWAATIIPIDEAMKPFKCSFYPFPNADLIDKYIQSPQKLNAKKLAGLVRSTQNIDLKKSIEKLSKALKLAKKINSKPQIYKQTMELLYACQTANLCSQLLKITPPKTNPEILEKLRKDWNNTITKWESAYNELRRMTSNAYMFTRAERRNAKNTFLMP